MKLIAKAKSEPAAEELPTEKDFDPWNGFLDAQSAWKHFGGLDLDQAYQKFCENPLNYQEDFMFMGPKAFKFYFPVVARYLQECPYPDEFGDSQAWILGKVMCYQLEESEDEELRKQIGDLCHYVRTHLCQYGETASEQERINAAWIEAESQLVEKRAK